jgi:hypothetical protein
MLDEKVLDGWKLLAEQGKTFHAEVVLSLISHIEQQDLIIEGLKEELNGNTDEYAEEQRDFRKLKHGIG